MTNAREPNKTPLPNGGVIETERLRGEPLNAAHLPGLLQLFQDLRVTPTLTATGKPLPTADVEKMVRTAETHWQTHGWGPWALLDSTTGAFVGRGGLRVCVIEERETTEVGYALLPEFWGRGLATEIARASVRVAFDELNLPELVGFTLTTNFASQKILQKAGFVFVHPFDYVNLPHFLYGQTNPSKKDKT